MLSLGRRIAFPGDSRVPKVRHFGRIRVIRHGCCIPCPNARGLKCWGSSLTQFTVKGKCSDNITLVQRGLSIPSPRASATTTTFPTSALLRTRWRGSHESIVTRQCLLQQRRTRRAINRSLSFCHRFVFHQCVALQPMGSQISFTGSETGLKTHFHIACPPIEIEM